MINSKKRSLSIAAFFLSLLANAQQFQYRSDLDTVTASGFYAIPITPALSSHLKTDFSDFRIVDGKGHWVPHLIRFVIPDISGTQTINLKVASSEIRSSNSVIVIENPEKNLLNSFILRLKNAAAERMASLSGSEDNKNWFIIADSLLVSNPDFYNKDENSKLISFPPTQYSYYRLTIRNDTKDPLNVVSIAAPTSVPHNSEDLVFENPTPVISQLDSGKLTLVKVNYDKPYQFDQISLEVKSPALYDRIARIFLEVKPGVVNSWQGPFLKEIELSSRNPHSRDLPLVKAKTFYIIISNQDNPPLEIKAVNTFQRMKQAIAYLETNKPYHLLLDNPGATQPNYDLQQFDKDIPVKLQALQTRQLTAINIMVTNSTKKIGDWWIWATIGGVILLLAYLTWGLTKDMNKKKEIV